MKIIINNWDKYQPRKDLKSMPWVSIQSDIWVDPKFHTFTAIELWVWVYILTMGARFNTGGKIICDMDYLVEHSRVTLSEFEITLQKLETKQIVTISRDSNVNEKHVARDPNVQNLSKQNRTEHNITKQTYAQKNVLSMSDFENVYKSYPKKQGKARGLKKAEVQIKTHEDLANLTKAVTRYKEHCIKNKIEARYIKHFSTFMSEWTDWLDSETGTALETNSTNDLLDMLNKEFPEDDK